MLIAKMGMDALYLSLEILMKKFLHEKRKGKK